MRFVKRGLVLVGCYLFRLALTEELGLVDQASVNAWYFSLACLPCFRAAPELPIVVVLCNARQRHPSLLDSIL